MIRPASFGFNKETASSNSFQKNAIGIMDSTVIQQQAISEFDEAVKILKDLGVNVWVADDTTKPEKPDAVFPNNWISFHKNGTVVFYPMMAENRRSERRWDVLETILDNNLFKMNRLLDYSKFEREGKFLEGTGSLVIDKINRRAYCCPSPRTNEVLVKELCKELELEPFIFEARDKKGNQIYHTNVVLSIAQKYAVVCLEAIFKVSQREALERQLTDSGKAIVNITLEQMENYCANCLEVFGTEGESYCLMSTTASSNYYLEQLTPIFEYSTVVTIKIPTIELYGGGSIRCMICEIG
jgi:hypothetical protein